MIEALEAHLRLCSTLKPRTHEWQPPVTPAPKTRVVKRPGVGRGQNQAGAVALRIGRKYFSNMKQACTLLRVGMKTIRTMLSDGRATRCTTRQSRS